MRDGFQKTRLSLAGIRELDMVTYLASLGYQPQAVKKSGVDYWYLSPLRIEGEASFKVNRQMNRWYDHGLGKGGNLVDFGLLYFNCNIRELIDRFPGDLSFAGHLDPVFAFQKGSPDEMAHRIDITGEYPLRAYPLVRYLHERRIPLAIAGRFCSEVSYRLGGRSYYGIGFRNNAGGYEIRNAWFKCSSSPKDITTIGGGSEQVHIFEGFFDFLSFKTFYQGDPMDKGDCLVLNGAAMFERARQVVAQYRDKRLWLDRDRTGQAYTKYALSLGEGYRDESTRYLSHKDLNDWMTGKSPAPGRRQQQKVAGKRKI